MAEIHAFRGWRYDVGRVGSLSEVTAPPYDVISPQQQKEFYELHPCNVIRLILNRDEPGDDDPNARYTRAANFLKQWRSDGTLMLEREDAIYVYHQVFDWEGKHYVRKGFLARLRLEEFGKGQVYPHEQTMSGPKADRLLLTKACKMNLSPIFGLYPDDKSAAQQPLEDAVRKVTPLEATDHLGVVHRMWAVTEPKVVNAVRAALREKPIFIADGHHRYETALNYRNWLKSEGQLTGDDAAANFVLMMFVGMSDPGLAILPTHRLISGLPQLKSEDVQAALKGHFEIEYQGQGSDVARQTWDLMAADGGQEVFGFGTAADGKWLFARLTDKNAMKQLVTDRSDAWRKLGVSILHKLVLDHLIAKKFPGEQACKYVHLVDEVNSAMDDKSCQLACLVAPAQIEHVEDIASQFEKMPPKSTYFYPKLQSGLVFNPVE